MKANELRIGNLILMSFKNVVETVNARTIGFINVANKKGHKHPFEPIHLTEEWLLKFGFERKIFKTSVIEIDIVYYEFNGHQVYLINGKKTDSCFEFEYYIPETKERFNLFRSFYYVHELQNIYFALTGEDLEIN